MKSTLDTCGEMDWMERREEKEWRKRGTLLFYPNHFVLFAFTLCDNIDMLK